MPLSERVGVHIRRHVIGYVGLFVALGGVAYAAPKITGKQIAKNAITSKKIKDGQVTSADVADNGLTGTDIDESTLQGLNVLLADGSVTTVKLADSAVTLPKLADAAVSQQKLAFDPATQAELDGATTAIPDSRLGTISTPGKVTDSALSSNVALLNAGQTFTGQNTFQAGVTVASSSPLATAFDASDADIGTALAVGSNDVTTNSAAISAAELATLDLNVENPARSASIPVTTLANETDHQPIDFSASDGTSPDFVFGTEDAPELEWDGDAAGGAADADTDFVVATVNVPSDYVSFGALRVRVKKTGSSGTDEFMRCEGQADNDNAGSGLDSIGINGTGPQTLSFSVPSSYAAGRTAVFHCQVTSGNGGAGNDFNDAVRVTSMAFTYTAIQ